MEYMSLQYIALALRACKSTLGALLLLEPLVQFLWQQHALWGASGVSLGLVLIVVVPNKHLRVQGFRLLFLRFPEPHFDTENCYEVQNSWGIQPI